ncbi:MAG TPA: glycosyltransferase family 39 protein, partial [Phototrophicaceae bacterium]|nr:glycosyltransferase family 39 protein [Phototrophicaceae bacterium]
MCPINRQLTRLDALALLLVLLVAALLRLGNPGVVEFLHDEAMLSLLAQDMAAGKGVPLTGIPSSVGVPNPPISVYIMALPYALGADPQAATLFVAALNVIGVGLLWLITYRYLGRLIALIAGLAYAVNPWALLYSRKIWAQDFHTPLVLLTLGLGLYGFGENKRWAQVLCLPVLIVALQIHFAAWALLPLYLWLLWLGRKNLSWRVLFLSFALAGLTLVPFLLGLTQTLQADPNRISNALN